MELLRTLLFVPADSEKKIAKARTFHPDAFIFDLEDSVTQDRKPDARALLARELDRPGEADAKICVRVNGTNTPFFEQDLPFAAHPMVHAIMLPKCDDPREVARADGAIGQLESKKAIPPGKIRLILLLETVSGVLRAQELSRSSERIIALNFGAEDYSADIGVSRTRAPDEFAIPKTMVAMAAHAARLHAIDGIFADFNDEAGLIEETKCVKQMGFTGKALIHPSQIELVHRAFMPSEAEVAKAREIVRAFEAAKSKGSGVLGVDGRMVDDPVFVQARRILQLVEADGKQ